MFVLYQVPFMAGLTAMALTIIMLQNRNLLLHGLSFLNKYENRVFSKFLQSRVSDDADDRALQRK
jgi:hypothetical protein